MKEIDLCFESLHPFFYQLNLLFYKKKGLKKKIKKKNQEVGQDMTPFQRSVFHGFCPK